ncbi:DUF4169 family protein [Pseudooceanicola aestuarii]|uniref:DUF4169 family protein n=1 Tax=Pseudooceanicola aestuarii TaxID=2697319 RepID=UPI0013D498B9|nr:DUF4169 family protein [Pseudooceanicola aestuarii]
MSTPVNLNRFRKDKARAAKRAAGDANAVKFGRTRAERRQDRATAEAAQRHLDGHRRDEGADTDDKGNAAPDDRD